MATQEQESTLTRALRHFEATEANLGKLKRLWKEITSLMPKVTQYTESSEYIEKCRAFEAIVDELPLIDGWKPSGVILSLSEIATIRTTAQEVGNIEEAEQEIFAPRIQFREYVFRFNTKKRALIRDTLSDLIEKVDRHLPTMHIPDDKDAPPDVVGWDELDSLILQIATLIGDKTANLLRWGDLKRHLSFREFGDYYDITHHDWPAVKKGLQKEIYEDNEPLPVDVTDLGALVDEKPEGPVPAELQWDRLSDKDFERLVFALISMQEGYENPQWLTQTNAPDRGRDLSVTRVITDPLDGIIQQRVIIQCKHWLGKSINVKDITVLIGQMKLQEPPQIDRCIFATSGRFSSDAVTYIEKHNQSDSAMKISMWPESHLEKLLAERPALIATFKLR